MADLLKGQGQGQGLEGLIHSTILKYDLHLLDFDFLDVWILGFLVLAFSIRKRKKSKDYWVYCREQLVRWKSNQSSILCLV